MSDPIQAARNVTRLEDAEKRIHDIRILVVRGLITDLVTQLARVLANRTATGPEEVHLKDQILKETLAYMRGAQSGAASISYLSPNDQARTVAKQSPAVAELKRMEREQPMQEKRAAEIIDRVAAEVGQALEGGSVPYKLPTPKSSV
jgi:hypothetical protein